MDVRELRPGLWRWTAPHPDWTPEQGGPDGWEREVGCVSCESAGALVLIDPLAPAEGTEDAERFWRALDRDVERMGAAPDVLLTIFWHARSAQAIADRYGGARVWAHAPAADEARKRVGVTDTFDAGDPLPGGVEALDAHRAWEIFFWLPEHRALVAGDALLGAPGGGVRIPEAWLADIAPDDYRRSLQPLLELPVELILVAHGEPVLENGREALARALATEA